MSRTPTITSAHAAYAASRRREHQRQRRRLERDLRALRTMQGTVRRGEIICAALTIPLLTGLWFIALLKLHFLTGSTVAAVSLSLGLGALVWAIGRRWLTFAWLIVIALIIVVFHDAPLDIPDAGDSKDARRRAKLARAIGKREALLKALDEGRP